jgi:hypothetical protein
MGCSITVPFHFSYMMKDVTLWPKSPSSILNNGNDFFFIFNLRVRLRFQILGQAILHFAKPYNLELLQDMVRWLHPFED